MLGELMTTRRTWPIIDATIASNGSIATPAVVSQRRELFWCGETRRWLVVDSPTSPTYLGFHCVLVAWAQSTFVAHDQLRLTSQITLVVLTLRSLCWVRSVWGAACRRVTTSDALIVNDLT